MAEEIKRQMIYLASVDVLRRFIPKGKDLSILTQEDLDRFASYLNTLPRKSLGYFAPEDLFLRELSAII